MNPMSSTAKAGGGWGFLAALAMGLLAMAFPELYARVPPGFEAGLAVLIGTIMAKRQKENVYVMTKRE